MLFEPRLSTKALAELCHRLGVETESGIDVRRTWQREAENARGRTRAGFAKVRDTVAAGESLARGMAKTGNLFPRMMVEMVHVGEQTGGLERVFNRLADYYRHRGQMQRAFLVGITWPMIQLAIALGVVGLLILVMGVVAQRNNGQPIDLLGFGLIGVSGFVIYINILIVLGLCIAGLMVAVRHGMQWTRPLQRAVIRLPVVGPCLRKFALARMTWAMHLVMNVEMDLRRVVPLVLRAAGNDYYTRHSEAIVADVIGGRMIYEAFARTGAFPADFLDALQVGEDSGQIVETMGRLSRRYEEESEVAMRTLTVVAGVVVWALVGGLIIMIIFRLFGFYLGVLNDALNM